MKLFTAFLLGFTIVVLALTSYVQNQTIQSLRKTLHDMTANPACMVAPVAPVSSNPETPRRLI